MRCSRSHESLPRVTAAPIVTAGRHQRCHLSSLPGATPAHYPASGRLLKHPDHAYVRPQPACPPASALSHLAPRCSAHPAAAAAADQLSHLAPRCSAHPASASAAADHLAPVTCNDRARLLVAAPPEEMCCLHDTVTTHGRPPVVPLSVNAGPGRYSRSFCDACCCRDMSYRCDCGRRGVC